MIAIIDYGMGNLRSVLKKFENLKIDAQITGDLKEIEKADKLILPGVGHFANGVKNLKEKGIWEVLNEKVLVKQTPILGICLGMQCAVIEFGRHVLGLSKANSTEMDLKTPDPVIDLMADQKEITDKGGTMRLGAYTCNIAKGSLASKIYQSECVNERHRHRYEFNNIYTDQYKAAGMIPSGTNPDTNLVEIMEIPGHKWFIGVQFHPEYRSTVMNPHPLFVNFVKAALE